MNQGYNEVTNIAKNLKILWSVKHSGKLFAPNIWCEANIAIQGSIQIQMWNY